MAFMVVRLCVSGTPNRRGSSATNSKARIAATGHLDRRFGPGRALRHRAYVGAGDGEMVAMHVDHVACHAEIAIRTRTPEDNHVEPCCRLCGRSRCEGSARSRRRPLRVERKASSGTIHAEGPLTCINA